MVAVFPEQDAVTVAVPGDLPLIVTVAPVLPPEFALTKVTIDDEEDHWQVLSPVLNCAVLPTETVGLLGVIAIGNW